MKHPGRPRRQSAHRAGGLILALSVIVLSGAHSVSAQCALCRDAVTSSSPETREAMNYAIIGLAFTPYGVAAVAAWVLSPDLRARVRARFKRRTSDKGGERL